MTDNETPAEEAATGATPISEILDRRHQVQAAHEPHQEVGAAPSDDDDDEEDATGVPAASITAKPAPQAQAAPASQAGDPDPASDPRAPKWYREHMAKVGREAAALRAENERLRTGQQPQPRPHPGDQGPELPNPATDPEGYHRAITGHFNAQMQQMQLANVLTVSERFARQQHGGEAFEECKAWLTTRPDLEEYFLTQPDPWASAFAHYSRERLAEEIGDDPNAWREKERERLRAEILAEQNGRSAEPAPAPAPRMRAAPPAPASQVRSAQPRDERGQFTGPRPLSGVFKHKFG